MTPGTRVRAKHGWTGTVVDLSGRHRWRVTYSTRCLGDGTDVAVKWDDGYIVDGENIVQVYPLATVRKLEVIEAG